MYDEIVIVSLLAFTVVGLYGLGSLANRRLSNKYLRETWSQLRRLRIPGELRSLGSSGFVITLEEPRKDIARLDVSLVLEKREFPLNWLVDRLRKKRDTLTISILYNKGIYDKDLEVFRRGNYYGDSLHKYREKCDRVDDIYIHPSGINMDRKVKRIEGVLRKYDGVYLVSISRHRRMLTVVASAREIYRLKNIVDDLLSL